METKKLFSGLTAIAVSTVAAGALVSSPSVAYAGDAAAHGEKSCGAKAAGDKSCAAKHEDCTKLTDAKAKEECEAKHKAAHAGEKSCGAKAADKAHGEKSCGGKH